MTIFHLGLEARIIIQDINQTNKLKPISKCSQASQTVVGGSVGWAEVCFWWWRQKMDCGFKNSYRYYNIGSKNQ